MITKMLVIEYPKPDGKITQIFEEEWFMAMRDTERIARRKKRKRR